MSPYGGRSTWASNEYRQIRHGPKNYFAGRSAIAAPYRVALWGDPAFAPLTRVAEGLWEIRNAVPLRSMRVPSCGMRIGTRYSKVLALYGALVEHFGAPDGIAGP